MTKRKRDMNDPYNNEDETENQLEEPSTNEELTNEENEADDEEITETEELPETETEESDSEDEVHQAARRNNTFSPIPLLREEEFFQESLETNIQEITNFLFDTLTAQTLNLGIVPPRLFSASIYSDYRPRFSRLEYQEAEEHFRREILSENMQLPGPVDHILLNIMLDYYFLNRYSWPNLTQIVDLILREECNCFFLFGRTNVRRIVTHYITEEAFIPNCFFMEHIYSFEIIHHHLPSLSQLQAYITRQAEFAMDPEAFYQNDKTHVPALNVENLPIIKGNNTNCALCQDTISTSQNCVQLKPCNHMFHSEKEDCLGESTVFKWLSENNFCPLCKEKIRTQ